MKAKLIFNPPFIAHRGASALAPENTLAAFKAAEALGLHWLELDVMLTACGEVIVFHDETIERITNGQGRVADFSYAELKALEGGEHIPTLVSVLEWMKTTVLSLNIELKAPEGKEKETVSKVLALVESPDLELQSRCLFSSFSVAVLKELRQQSKTARLGFLLDEEIPGWEKDFKELSCSTLNVNEALLTPEALPDFKKHLTPLLAYTVNDPDRAARLFDSGVAAIFTDCPKNLINHKT